MEVRQDKAVDELFRRRSNRSAAIQRGSNAENVCLLFQVVHSQVLLADQVRQKRGAQDDPGENLLKTFGLAKLKWIENWWEVFFFVEKSQRGYTARLSLPERHQAARASIHYERAAHCRTQTRRYRGRLQWDQAGHFGVAFRADRIDEQASQLASGTERVPELFDRRSVRLLWSNVLQLQQGGQLLRRCGRREAVRGRGGRKSVGFLSVSGEFGGRWFQVFVQYAA